VTATDPGTEQRYDYKEFFYTLLFSDTVTDETHYHWDTRQNGGLFQIFSGGSSIQDAAQFF
jgi:hypothetical protein